MMIAIEGRKGRNTVIMLSKRRYIRMVCSQWLRHYALMFLRAMSMIVAIEKRKGRETVIMLSKRRSSELLALRASGIMLLSS